MVYLTDKHLQDSCVMVAKNNKDHSRRLLTQCQFIQQTKQRHISFNIELQKPCIIIIGGDRGYYMAARRYEISLRVLKNISRVSAANE